MSRHPRVGGRYRVLDDWVPSGPRGALMAGDVFRVQQASIDFLGGGGWDSAKVVLEHQGEPLTGDGAHRTIHAPPRDPALRVEPLEEH